MNKKLMVTMGATLAIAAGAVSAQGGGQGSHPGGNGRDDGMRGGMPALIQEISDAAGLSLTDIRSGLQDGKTLSDLITANGGNIETVTADITQLITDQINARVTLGQLTQERADSMIGELPTHIEEALNSTTPLRSAMPDGFNPKPDDVRGVRGEVLDQLVIATGQDRDAVVEALQGGQTVTDLLTAANVTVDSFVDTLVQPMQERLLTQVQAGRINQAIADARIALARAELEFALTKTRDPQ